jgi:putative transposase
MGRKVKVLQNYTPEEVKAFFDKDDKYKIGLRLYAVYQVSLGKSSRQLEELYNTSFKQIRNWVNNFDNNGIEGLRDKKRSGRPARLNSGQMLQLQKNLLATPDIFGYNTSTWTGPIVCDHIKKTFQVEYKQAQIYNLLHELGYTYQRGRGIYPERNEELRAQAKIEIKKH